jgi:MFS family permease
MAPAGGSTGGGNTGGSSSSSTSSEAGRRPEDIAGEEGESEEAPEGLDVAQDNITITRESWGDKLAMFTIPFITFLDRRSHNGAERIANVSPFFAKLINDGAYLRAMLGTISTLAPIAAAIIALAAVADNAAEIAAGDYSKIITPAWTFLLAIAVLGAFDAAAGFTGAMVFIIGSVITVGHIPDSGEVRTMMGIMLVSVGPALLTTGFRTIRKQAALNFSAWWERIADFVIAPFMAGWSISAMVSGLPALAGLTLDVANHVNDFVFFVAIAIFVRVALEELAASGYPARLNKINPDEIPDPSILQRSIVLVIKYFVWVFIGGALIGPSWQVWVGSALFVFPTVVGWFTDKFPNSPRIWRILPTGIPGLAFTLFVASATSAVVGSILGTNPDLGKWSFVILPIPMLAITILGWFGRHGAIDADGNEEERPGKRNKWIYRIGGVAIMVLTLKLAGVI